MDLLNEHALSQACKGQGHRGHWRCLPCSCALTGVLVSHLCTAPAPMAPLHLRDGSRLWGQITPEKFFVCFWGLFTESALLDWKFRAVAAGGQWPAVTARARHMGVSFQDPKDAPCSPGLGISLGSRECLGEAFLSGTNRFV